MILIIIFKYIHTPIDGLAKNYNNPYTVFPY